MGVRKMSRRARQDGDGFEQRGRFSWRWARAELPGRFFLVSSIAADRRGRLQTNLRPVPVGLRGHWSVPSFRAPTAAF